MQLGSYGYFNISSFKMKTITTFRLSPRVTIPLKGKFSQRSNVTIFSNMIATVLLFLQKFLSLSILGTFRVSRRI